VNIHAELTIREPGTVGTEYIGLNIMSLRARLMSSKLCVIVRGHDDSTRHLYHAIAAGCVPVLVNVFEGHHLPFSTIIDWSAFSARANQTLLDQLTAHNWSQCGLLRWMVEDVLSKYAALASGLRRVREVFVIGRGDPVTNISLNSQVPFWRGTREFESTLLQEVETIVSAQNPSEML